MKRQNAVAALWFLSLMLVQASPVRARALNVPEQFPSINSAIAAAKNKDEIIVAPGIYTENLVLRAGVILRSRGSTEERSNFFSAAQTIIQAARAENQIVLGAKGAVLDGFSLKDIAVREDSRKEHYGIFINGTSMTITNCIIASLSYHGIGIKGPTPSGASLLKNNRIYDNRVNGVICDKEAVVQIEACEIYLNGKSGIHNANQAQVIIKNNIIRENDVDGIMNTDEADAFISNNMIYQNGLNGIGFQQSSRGKVEQNQITGNRQAGIGLRMKAKGIILNNTISDNLIGVGLMEIEQVTIESNKINNNNMVGIGLVNCKGGKVILRKNDLRGNRIRPISPNLACELIEEDNINW
jgi:parallel beta-helix repeat protein